MSKINPDLTWYPPHFPKQGRLPTDTAATKRNSNGRIAMSWHTGMSSVTLRVKP